MRVLVTGTSSGFGQLTALTLARAGHAVAATMRGVDGKNAAKAAAFRDAAASEGLNLHVVELDVASDASAEAGVAAATEALGGLDVVVNNAGYAVMGPQEAFTVDQVKAQFDTNVFGVLRVNRAALPTLRAQGSGLVINISSGLGRFILPYMSPYIASKWALEALSESLRYELAPTGVEVVIVQPGAFPTDGFAQLVGPADQERVGSYGAALAPWQARGAAFGQMFQVPDPPNPQEVADAILGILDTPRGDRPLRVVVDRFTGDGARAINGVAEQVQRGMLPHLGLADVLQVKLD